MRHAVGLFALVCSVIIIAVAARYGFKTSDSDADGYIWSFIYGAITLGGLGGHTVSVRLWRYGKPGFALFVFGVSLFALAISLSNSLGAMAGRMNTTVAARVETAESVRDDKRDLKSKQDERASTKFDPADESAVEAARRSAEAAKTAKEAECGVRGQRCRDKEEAETKALAAYTTASTNKAATDHARDLDADIKNLKETIKAAGPVLEANSQGSALARLFALPDGDAAKLSTYQNLAMAIGIEIMIVIALIAYEVMGEHERELRSLPMPKAPQAPRTIAGPVEDIEAALEPVELVEDASEEEEPAGPLRRRGMMTALPSFEEEEEPKAFPVPTRPRLIASRPDPIGSVAEIMAEIMEAGRGKVELADVFAGYVAACEAHGKRPIPANDFPAALADLCQKLGIKIDANGRGVFLLKVRLKKSAKNAEAEGGK